MQKSTFTPLYEAFRRKLIAMRQAENLTQRQLAKRLKREHSMIAKIEQGERRLDVVEFYWVCVALKHDPEKVFSELVRAFGKAERR